MGKQGGGGLARQIRSDALLPPPGCPPPAIDLPAVRAIMVEAAKSAAKTKTLLAGKNTSAPNKLLAGSVMALYGLVEALLEKALLPLA